MAKLKFTDTARVLHAALGADTFTVEELAKGTSTKSPTVRTVLFRAQALLEEIPEKTTGVRRAGRRSKRYRLRDSARETLSEELTELMAKLRPREERPDGLVSVEAALGAASSSLELAREEKSAAGENSPASTQNDWLTRARLQLDAARRLLPAIHDPAERQIRQSRLMTLEAELGQLLAPSRLEWRKRLGELAQNFAPMHSSEPADSENRDERESVDDVPCLWFDATDPPHDTWSQDIARGLASCRPWHFPVRDLIDGDQHFLTELSSLIAGMPAESLIFVTMRSHQGMSDPGAMQLLCGPLHSILHRMDQGPVGPAPTITVMDHDLNEDSFWINHRIANLRYYPTARANLARVIANSLIMDKQASGPFAVEPAMMKVLNAAPTVLPSGGRLSRVAAELGFAMLERYLERLAASHSEPVCLLGVNRGGYLLAQLLWQRRGKHDRHLVKCDCRPDSGKVILERDIPEEICAFVIIDDVVRTGRTMDAVRTYLRDHYPAVNQYAIALAAVSANYPGSGVPYDIDYCPWISREPTLKFPWSDAPDKEPDPTRYLDPTGVNQVGGWLTEHTASVIADYT